MSQIQAGEFHLDSAGTGFTIGGCAYLIRTRAEHTAGKPSQFFIQVHPFKFISSLYPTARADIFGFEVGRVWWAMQFKAGAVKVWQPRFLAPVAQEDSTRHIRREQVRQGLQCNSVSRK